MQKGDFIYIIASGKKSPAEAHLFLFDNYVHWAAGIVSSITRLGPTVVLPNDPMQKELIPPDYQLIPAPNKVWTNWAKKSPPVNSFIYIRDFDPPDVWEIGWAMGGESRVTVVLPNDPSLSQVLTDQWQIVPPPLWVRREKFYLVVQEDGMSIYLSEITYGKDIVSKNIIGEYMTLEAARERVGGMGYNWLVEQTEENFRDNESFIEEWVVGPDRFKY